MFSIYVGFARVSQNLFSTFYSISLMGGVESNSSGGDLCKDIECVRLCNDNTGLPSIWRQPSTSDIRSPNGIVVRLVHIQSM